MNPQRKMSSRVSASLLHALEMQDCVSHSWDEYLDSISSMVSGSSREQGADGAWQTTGKLADLKARVKAKRETTPLFNTRHWVRNFEGAATAMWAQFEQGQAPSHIKVRDCESGEAPVDAQVYVEDHICPASKLSPDEFPIFLDELGAPPSVPCEQGSETSEDEAALKEDARRLISDIQFMMAPAPAVVPMANPAPTLHDCARSLLLNKTGLGAGISPVGLEVGMNTACLGAGIFPGPAAGISPVPCGAHAASITRIVQALPRGVGGLQNMQAGTMSPLVDHLRAAQ